MANMMQMMKKVQTFKVKMQELQDRVKQTAFAGTAGGGAVSCAVVNGRVVSGSLKIAPDLVKADEVDVLEDLVTIAVNDALTKAEQAMADETGKLMEDLGLPKNMDLPF